MTIHDLAAIHLRAGKTLKADEAEGSKEKPVVQRAAEVRSPDKVEISEEARQLASKAQQTYQERDAEIEERREFSKEQVLEIRRWIADGFYELPTTVEEVARRILASGDLGV
jgi:anti-sigma28 factor (negative regulator of flagellin synthesis)